jgi:hypothetical protein
MVKVIDGDQIDKYINYNKYCIKLHHSFIFWVIRSAALFPIPLPIEPATFRRSLIVSAAFFPRTTRYSSYCTVCNSKNTRQDYFLAISVVLVAVVLKGGVGGVFVRDARET